MLKVILQGLLVSIASISLACSPKTDAHQSGTMHQLENPIDQPEDLPTETACPEERKQACTREYRPVCGTSYTGPKCAPNEPCPLIAIAKNKTYPNACVACADKAVMSYAGGACQNDKPQIINTASD